MGWSTVIYQVYEACEKPPIGSSHPGIVLDYVESDLPASGRWFNHLPTAEKEASLLALVLAYVQSVIRRRGIARYIQTESNGKQERKTQADFGHYPGAPST